MGLFELIIAVVVMSTVGSIAKSYFMYRARRLPPVDRDAMLRIEEQLGALREEVAELQERVDFTERVLARNREGEMRLEGR
jgi:hypothetical protein